jgi:class 3 adenylate cyclase
LLLASRYVAEHIDGARYVELAGEDYWFVVGDTGPLLDAIEEFLTGRLPRHDVDRVLATALFTDVGGSTDQAAGMGDRRWSELLATHDGLTRAELERFRGREIRTTGDGFLAVFDGPGRAVRCACAIRDAVRAIGIQVRVGLHTGEIELHGDEVGGIAVHIAQCAQAHAQQDEVLVSRTVADLVGGSGITFAGRGTHALKGVPNEWQLFAVEGSALGLLISDAFHTGNGAHRTADPGRGYRHRTHTPNDDRRVRQFAANGTSGAARWASAPLAARHRLPDPVLQCSGRSQTEHAPKRVRCGRSWRMTIRRGTHRWPRVTANRHRAAVGVGPVWDGLGCWVRAVAIGTPRAGGHSLGAAPGAERCYAVGSRRSVPSQG